MKYTAIVYPDDQSTLLVAECPEWAVASQGCTEAEAMTNGRGAVELYPEAFPKMVPGRHLAFRPENNVGENRSFRCYFLIAPRGAHSGLFLLLLETRRHHSLL